MPQGLDLVGQVYSRLKVVSRNPINTNQGRYRWDCVCDCGKTITVNGNNLRTGKITSCGCYHLEVLKTSNTTHGLTGTPEHNIWKSIKQRTTNEKNQDYTEYGGRGITLSPEWNSFENFYRDMGPRPSSEHSIDRKENDKGYYAGNCYWATPEEQANNKRSNVKYMLNGKELTAAQIAIEHGVDREPLRSRLRRGQDVVSVLAILKAKKENDG